MAKSTTLSFRGGSVTPGQGINEADINPLVVNRKLQDGTPQQQTYDPLTSNQHFDFGRVKFKKNGAVVGSYDPFDSDKDIDLPEDATVTLVSVDAADLNTVLADLLSNAKLPVLQNVGGSTDERYNYSGKNTNGDFVFYRITENEIEIQLAVVSHTDGTVSYTTLNLDDVVSAIDELPSDEHGYFNSSLYMTPGDGTTTILVMGDFRISENRDVHGDSIEFVPTHQEGGVDFGEVWLEPGTYILATQITLQWVGNPRGTFLPLVANVADQPFDFSYEHEDVVRTTRIITRTTRGKLGVNIAIDADTPPMGVWVKNLEVAQIASLSQTNVAHDTTLTGTGKVADPLGVTSAAFGQIKNIPTSISQFRNGDVIPVDGPNGPAKMQSSDLQTAILGGPIDEAVRQWLAEHPEVTTTVEDHSLTYQKLVNGTLNFVTPEMFGAAGDGVTDDTVAIQAAMDSGSCVVFRTRIYLVSPRSGEYGHVCLHVRSGQRIHLNGATIKIANNSYARYCAFGVNYLDNISEIISDVLIEGGNIVGDIDGHTGTSGSQGYGVAVSHSNNVILRGLNISKCWGDAICISSMDSSIDPGLKQEQAYNVSIQNCILHDCRRQGITIACGTNILVENCEIYNLAGTVDPGAAIDIEPDTTEIVDNVTVRNCVAHDCKQGFICSGTPAASVVNIVFDSCKTDRQILIHNSGDVVRIYNCSSHGIVNGRYSSGLYAIGCFTTSITFESNSKNAEFHDCVIEDTIVSGSSPSIVYFSNDGSSAGRTIGSVNFENCSFIITNNSGISFATAVRVLNPNVDSITFDSCSFRSKTDTSTGTRADGIFNVLNNGKLTITDCNFEHFGNATADNSVFLCYSAELTIKNSSFNLVASGGHQRFIAFKQTMSERITLIGVRVDIPLYSTFLIVNNVDISSPIELYDNTFTFSVEMKDNAVNNITVVRNIVSNAQSGNTASRPTSKLVIGQTFFDTQLGKMIVWNGSNWVNMDGTPLT